MCQGDLDQFKQEQVCLHSLLSASRTVYWLAYINVGHAHTCPPTMAAPGSSRADLLLMEQLLLCFETKGLAALHHHPKLLLQFPQFDFCHHLLFLLAVFRGLAPGMRRPPALQVRYFLKEKGICPLTGLRFPLGLQFPFSPGKWFPLFRVK